MEDNTIQRCIHCKGTGTPGKEPKGVLQMMAMMGKNLLIKEQDYWVHWLCKMQLERTK